MAEPHPDNRDIIGDLAGIAVGFGLLAVAAFGMIAARQRQATQGMRPGARSLNELMRQRRAPRPRPPEAGSPIPAIPPRGPLPRQGGAAASLDTEA